MCGEIVKRFNVSFRALKDLFFPRKCVVCGSYLEIDEKTICKVCLEDLPLTYTWCYSDNFIERRLIDKGINVSAATSLFFYREIGHSEIIRSFKYRGNISIGKNLSRELAKIIGSSERFKEIQLVLPVPLHPFKYFRRGFNQSEIIAKEIAKELNIIYSSKVIKKRYYTKTQTKYSKSERSLNVEGSFSFNQQKMLELKQKGIKHLLIVDDVLTTGATLSAILKPLQEANFTIYVATLACVE